ncbi:MAG: hypothetical protein M3493_09960 [Actinomycetota bacterium]|nr:hypothetical protein [Euzebyaceae bacterium]MDQ3453001.1 hypothetical protein [Actinomycetota bacterium]
MPSQPLAGPVMLVDADRRVRTAVHALLECTAELGIVIEAATSVEALQKAMVAHPSAVTMDLLLPELETVLGSSEP